MKPGLYNALLRQFDPRKKDYKSSPTSSMGNAGPAGGMQPRKLYVTASKHKAPGETT